MKWRNSRWEFKITRELVDFFGVETQPRWIASNDGGKSSCAQTDRRDGPWYHEHDLRQWLADQQGRGFHREYEILYSPIYPQVTRYADEAIKLLEAMEASPWRILSKIVRGNGSKPPYDRFYWNCELRCCEHEAWDFSTHPASHGTRDGYAWASHFTFPGAVARAAYRLMQVIPQFKERQA